MTETRSILLNEAVVRETEEVLGRFEQAIAEQNQKLDESFAKLMGAIRLVSGTVTNASSSGHLQQQRSSPAVPTTRETVYPSSKVMRGYRSGLNSNSSPVTRILKLDFHRFSGDRVREWLFKLEQFFSLDFTPEELKVRIASSHFDGAAKKWHQSLLDTDFGVQLLSDWKTYKLVLQEHFAEVLDDPIAELKQLKETTNGIEEYHKKFELLTTRVNLTEVYLVRAYLDGLQPDTRVNVLMFQPQTVSQCFLVGRLYEQAHPLKSDSAMKVEEEEDVAEIEVETEVATKSSAKRAHEVILKEDLITQFQVPVSDSKILRNIELREENLELENLEYVVKNEDLKQDGVQEDVRLVVDGTVQRSLKVIRNTKIYSAHQLFGKLSQYKERLGIKKKRKGFKSRMFKYKSCFRKLHSLTFSKRMRMVETSSDLLLLNGKDSPARTAMGFKLEAGEIASSNKERLELCPENNGYLESSNLELVLMKEEPESVKVSGVTLWTQSCNISDLIQAKMMGTKSLCNNESVYVLEDLSSAILEKNHSQIYCGFDCDAFLSGGVSRFWKFIGFDIIPGRKVLTKRKKTFYKCRRFKFKHGVIQRAVQSGFEVNKERSCTEYLCLFLTSKVTTLAHIFLGCGDMTLNLKKKWRFRLFHSCSKTWWFSYIRELYVLHKDVQNFLLACLAIMARETRYSSHFKLVYENIMMAIVYARGIGKKAVYEQIMMASARLLQSLQDLQKFTFGVVLFQIKHKWRFKFLHSVSELGLCLASFALSTSYANLWDCLWMRRCSTVGYEDSIWEQNDKWTKPLCSRRLVVYKLGSEPKTVERMYECVDQLVKMELAKEEQMLEVTQSQTFDPGITSDSTNSYSK